MGGDDGEHEASALDDELSVGIRVVLADRRGHPTKVPLDRPSDAVLEVDEQRPALRVEHVPRVGLVVQQLLRGAPTDYRLPQPAERVDEEVPILVSEVRRGIPTCNPLLNVCDPIREVRRRHRSPA